MRPVYLSAVSYVLGDETPLSGIDDETLQQQAPTLYGQGLKNCRVTDQPAARLAADSARQTLDTVTGRTVDAIVYCTDTAPDKTTTGDVWDFLLELDLPATPVTVVGGAGCGNLVSGLQAARNMILAEDAATVLLVTSDRVKTGTRYLDNGQTALSDGAASCLVSAEPHRQAFLLRGLATTFRVDIGTTAVRPIAVARATTAEIRKAIRRVTEPLGICPADFGRLLTGHYARTALAFLAMSAEVPVERVYCPAVAGVGHCFSADALISLVALTNTGEIADGEHVLILAVSPRSWSVAAATFAGTRGEPS